MPNLLFNNDLFNVETLYVSYLAIINLIKKSIISINWLSQYICVNFTLNLETVKDSTIAYRRCYCYL